MKNCFNLPITIHIIVERQFLMLLNITFSKNAHSNMLVDGPSCDIAVGVATVVSKSTNSSALGGIDELWD